MYKVSDTVFTKQIIPYKFISIEWCCPATTVDYEFVAVTADTTYVVVKSYGFD